MDAEVDWGMEDDFDPWQAGSAAPPTNEPSREEAKTEEVSQSEIPNTESNAQKPSQSRHLSSRPKGQTLRSIGHDHPVEQPEQEKKLEQPQTASRYARIHVLFN